jgi:hypothetical protein
MAVTHLAAAAGAVTWMLGEWVVRQGGHRYWAFAPAWWRGWWPSRPLRAL